jgi:trimeric autotransporter adhesin
MKRAILTTFFLAFTSSAISQDIELPHTLSNGSVADADEVMANFNDIVTGVNATVRKDDTLFNTATGAFAINPNLPTTGDQNTAIGYDALYNLSTGRQNTAIGYQSLRANNEGEANTASGAGALFSNTEGDDNTAVGQGALSNNTEGDNNTASGAGALILNTTGNRNTASGFVALFRNTSGNGNTASGYAALGTNTTGIANTAIGAFADVTSGDLENATAIGNSAKVNASNKVRIGNTDVSVIEGQVPFSPSSDARLKEDITVVDAGLALINDLNPVSYHRINSSSDDIEMGLLAQEVEEVLAAHGLSNSGMVHQASEDAYRSVRYNDLFAPVIRAIQELDDAAEAKDQQIASLQEQLKSQQEELLAVVQSQQEQMAMQQEQMAMQQEQIAQLQRVVEHQFASR